MSPNPPATVFVHWARLTGRLDATGHSLSAEERQRAAAFRFDRDRLRYCECRLRLRRQLADYIGAAPEKLVIVEGPHGKPALQDLSWHFNVSHSGDFYAAAFCRDHAVGIDIETVERQSNLEDLISHVCHPLEAQALSAEADDEARRQLFLCYWTAKEAFLKGIGCGFQVAPERVRIVGRPRSGCARVEADIPGAGCQAWKVHFLRITPAYVLTVAAHRRYSIELRESPFDA